MLITLRGQNVKPAFESQSINDHYFKSSRLPWDSTKLKNSYLFIFIHKVQIKNNTFHCCHLQTLRKLQPLLPIRGTR